jgi:hypothetical protein
VPLHLRPLWALPVAVLLAACSGSKEGGAGVAVITVDPAAAALCIGDTLFLKAHLLDASGDTVTGSAVRWTSSAPQMVSVDSASGLARAIAFGTAQITASVGSLRSATPGQLDVPSDLLPTFLPDTVVLAPGDTFSLVPQLRRASAGPRPNHTPVIAALDTAPARITGAGLVTAKAAGTASLSLSACGFTGHGAAKVFVPPDSSTGLGYLWLSGQSQIRFGFQTIVHNFPLSSKKPAFQVFSGKGANGQQFAYEDTVPLAGPGSFVLDSLRSSEVATAQCTPPRPFALYGDNSPSSLLSMRGTVAITSYSTSPGFRAVSGRLVGWMSGFANGILTRLDTLSTIFTFSAPLRDTTGVCP